MDFAQEVKAAADITTLIGQHVRLKRQGGNRYLGLCPFHSEKTPSFSVHGGLQFYKCFGCGKAGDVFTFLMEIQGLTFYEALKVLAEQQGREMPSSKKGPGADAAAKKRQELHYIHELAQGFYTQQLHTSKGRPALDYLRNRGIGKSEIKEFGLGYAPPGNGLLKHLRNRNLKTGSVRDSGLIGQSERDRSMYDRFRDRLMFPIHSDAGKIIAYGGRIRQSDKQPKYLNSPETPIYRKNTVLYSVHRARLAMRQANLAVLVEGYMDVIGVWRAGIRNAVATCGTALTARQIGVIRRHCETVVVNFDSDNAGQAAAERAVELLLGEGMNVRVLELPRGMDPDEYCRANGGEAYRHQLERAPRYFHWLLNRSRSLDDLSTSEGRTSAFKRLLKSVLLLPDEIKRVTTVTELAEHIGLPQGLALNELKLASGRRGRSGAGRAAGSDDGLSPSERLLITLLCNSERARGELLEAAREIAKNGLPSAQMLEAMLRVEMSGEGFQFAAVEGRLEAADRERLSNLLFDRDVRVPKIREGRSALEALRRQVVEGRYRDVRRKLAEAERSGDEEGMASLVVRMMELERKLGLAPGSRT